MDCPKCGSGADQMGKPYNIRSGGGGTTRVTMFKCSWCGNLHNITKPVKVALIMRDADLAKFITFGNLL